MTGQPKPTWKGRLIAFAISAALCVGTIEGVSRYLESNKDSPILSEMVLLMQPYMMFAGTAWKSPVWRNIEAKTDVPSTTTFNNFGFNIADDVSLPLNEEFRKKYASRQDQRLVIITGGVRRAWRGCHCERQDHRRAD
jgi:hypothetical protein